MECKLCNKPIRQNKTGYCQPCLVINNREIKIRTWLETGDIGMSVNTTVRGVIREYILHEQNNRCSICDMENIWNKQQLNFILDHIDGDASNSQRNNLRLICPNCDAQLDTYKSKNKASARNARKQFLKDTY